MHTVELLLDQRLENGVREMWDRLRAAGLPSLATHPHPTNRPHLTLLTATSLAGLPPLNLPIDVELAQIELLGRALVRRVKLTATLQETHTGAWSSLVGADPWPPPPEWIPHVSLALNVPADRRKAALHLLAAPPPERGHFTAARSYDTVTRTVTVL